MKINARITLLFSEDGMSIELNDSDAVIRFCDIKLDPQQTLQVMSRLGAVQCDCNVYGLDKVGMKRERQVLEFQMPENAGYGEDRKKVAREEAQKNCPDGWKSDGFFSSQESFFTRDGVSMARCSAVRWVTRDE